jgi:hypothetical protein
MAEEFNPAETGRRIASEYLSRRGWTSEWRRSLNRQLNPGFQREEFEEKERQCDQMEQENEDEFSAQVERWRRDKSPQAILVLQKIVEMLGRRTDLGFFTRRIVERLKRDLRPI